MSFVSPTAGVVVVDSRTRPGTITLPVTSQIVNRYLQFKDLYGAFGRSSLTLSTQVGESFEDGTTSKVFTDPFTFVTLYAASTTRWAQLGGTQTIQQTVSSLFVSSITIGSGQGWLQLPPIQTIAISTNTFTGDNATATTLSAQVLYVSSIIGVTIGGGTGNITTANLTSTVVGLGTVGYLSTGGGGGISAGNLTSTVAGLTTAGYLSSVSGGTGFVSSLTVNALTLGTGSGWLQLPPIQTIYSSTIFTQAQALYTLSSYFGGTSTLTTLDFYGLFGNYNNTVIAEVSTGGGTQELLMFKGSSVSDRVRVQTTGTFVVETGVSARLWSDSTVPTLSNVTPAFIINTSSNVGIQTATPGAPLDVAGLARAVVLSSQQVFASSIQGGVVTAPLVSSLQLNASTATALFVTASTVTTNALVLATNPTWIQISPLQSLGVSTNTLWTDQAYINTGAITTGIISSVATNSLTLGTGATWIQTAPIQTSIVSSVLTFADTTFFTTINVGSLSTVNTLEYAGLFNNYNNTALAEISTGAGTQELLVFKGSSASDRVRVQTTGVFVVETGVSARLWNSNTTQTVSNVTPAFIINTSSNVGIQTAAPGATLDVAGTARAITVSSQQLFVSSVTTGSVSLSNLTAAAIFTSSAVISTATIGIMSSLVTIASTVTANLMTASTVTTNAVAIGTVPSWIQTAPLQTLAVSTNTLWADQAYINTGAITTGVISTMTTNAVNLGSGATWIQAGPLLSPVMSSIFLYANTPFFDTVNVGSVSTMNSLEFAGLFNNYTNTVLAEISTGAGTQELLVFKGSSTSDRVRVQTTGAFVVETGVSARLFNSNTTQTLSNVTPAFIINTSSNVGIQTATPGATLDVAGSGRFQLLSTLAFNASSMNGQAYWAPEVSSLVGLGTLGYLSTASFTGFIQSTVTGLGSSRYLSSIPPLMSTAGILASSITTSSIITSSLQVNSLTIGTGTGWVNLGPIQTVAISSLQDNTNALYANTVYVGSVSTVNAIQYAGLFNSYSNTVLSEISTGAGTQELLVFKGSSTSDRVRVQTTGSFVVETGVSARLWNSNTTQTLSNATPAFLINTSSNVGIQMSNPLFPLDVGGTGRFQQVSTQNINLSTINGQTFGQLVTLTLTSTTIGLGTLGFLSTPPLLLSTQSLLTSSVTTSTIVTRVANVGAVSTVNPIQFFGLVGNYNNTAVAEVSTGTGTQELLMFKGSSASDRVRIQTTGAFVIETGVSARLWNPNATQTLSNTTPAFVININSNVGIQTANPTAALDVAGTIRAVTVSSQTAVVSSIVSLNFSSVQASVSSLIVNGLQFGDGTGWVNMGPIQTVSLSTITSQANLATTVTTSTLVLSVSSITGVASPFVSQGRLTANQNIPRATNDVLVQFVSDFDPNGWLLNAGTSTARVVPTIAGYYSATFAVWWSTGTGTDQLNIQIRKNGQAIAINQQVVNTVNGLTMTLTKMAFMNGTSDYFDFSAFTGTGGATQTIQFGGSANGPGVYYSVYLIR